MAETNRMEELTHGLIVHEIEALHADYEAKRETQVALAQADAKNLTKDNVAAFERATAHAKMESEVALREALIGLAAKYGGVDKFINVAKVQQILADRDRGDAVVAGDLEKAERFKKRAARLEYAVSRLTVDPSVRRSDLDERRASWYGQGVSADGSASGLKR